MGRLDVYAGSVCWGGGICAVCWVGVPVYLGTLDMLLVMCVHVYGHVCVCIGYSHASHSGYRLRGQSFFSKDRPQWSWDPRSRYVNGGHGWCWG